jgi:riboflavin transporter
MKKIKPKPNMIIFNNSPTLRTARLSIFTALSVIGSFIKIPSSVGTLAFDSTPGFFVAFLFGPLEGATVCGLGHLATATISGFPLGILHIPIALGMALAGAAVGLISKMNKKWVILPAAFIGIMINTALVVTVMPSMGMEAALTFVAPILLVAAILNMTAATSIYLALRGKLKT